MTSLRLMTQRVGITALAISVLLGASGCGLLMDLAGMADGGGGGRVSRTLPATINTDTLLTAGNYVVEQNVTVTGAVLNIDAGVTITFKAGTGLTVLSDGYLVARGTASQPITLTGQAAVPGYWNGLHFSASDASSNSLEYVTIEYAGGYDFFGWESARACLVLSGSGGAPAQISVTNCTLRHSAGVGFFTDENVVINDFSNNTFTQNATGAGHTNAAVASFLDKSSTYAGNTVDRVRVAGDTVDTTQTWAAIDVPYVLLGTVTVQGFLTIEPGATLQFSSGTGMTVLSAGSLSALGSAASPITFTGEVAVPGHWNGLYFSVSDSPANQLDYVTIEYAGGYKFFGWDTARTNLVLSESQAAITNSTFRHSDGWGVWVSNDSTVNGDLATANTYSNNILGDVYLEP